MKKDRRMLYSVLVIALAVLVIFWFNDGGTSDNNDNPKMNVECTVGLQNLLFDKVKIAGVNCYATDECGLFSFSVQELGIINDYGKVVLDMSDGAKDSTSYQVGEGTVRDFELSACSRSTTGTVKVYDKNGALLDSKSITVSR